MSHQPVISRPHPAGPGVKQEVYRFPNGYGASVVQHRYSRGGDEGLSELAVLQFTGDDNDDFDLTYSTPITHDVVGHLNEAGIAELLDAIAALPAPEPAAVANRH